MSLSSVCLLYSLCNDFFLFQINFLAVWFSNAISPPLTSGEILFFVSVQVKTEKQTVHCMLIFDCI